MKKIYVILLALVVMLFALGIKAHASDVTLAWDANSETDLAGYKIYVSQESGVYAEGIDVGNVTTYTVTGLADGEYFFVATAYNEAGYESGYSNEVTTDIKVKPDPPKNMIINKIIKKLVKLFNKMFAGMRVK